MKVRLLLPTAAALVLTACGPADSPKKALVGATLIDGTGAPAIPNAVIVIDNGTITAAGASVPVPDGFDKVNVSGKFIIPGLIDAHVTLDSDPVKAAAQVKSFSEAGITTIGDPLDKQAGIADLVIASNGTGPDATLAKIDRMAKAEIAPLQIIQAATQNGAAWLNQPNLGAIKAGQRADLVILNADPSADLKNLRTIYRVMQGGHWLVTAAK